MNRLPSAAAAFLLCLSVASSAAMAQMMACCLPDGSCIEATQAACESYQGSAQPGVQCSEAACAPPNLLTNPGAESGDMSGWVIDANGGNGWSATFDDYIYSGSHSFATSYGFGTRHQDVDLVAAGFSTNLLDSAPTVIMSEWVGARFDCGSRYFVRFELLNADQQVITFFEHGDQANPVVLPALTPYARESHTFTNYGPGLRFLRLIDGGSDVCFWAGNYGAHFDDALAAVVVGRACCRTDGSCQTTDMAACISSGGTPQAAGSTCSPSPCPSTGTGACCRGTTCAVQMQGECSGTYSRFAGASTVCNAPGNTTTPCCKADFNQLGGVGVQDIFDFLVAYFASSPLADINAAGGVTVQDVFEYLVAYFTGCG